MKTFLILTLVLIGIAVITSTASDEPIHILFILTNADSNYNLASRFKVYAQSLLATTDAQLRLHTIVDKPSKRIVEEAFPKSLSPRVTVSFYDRDEVTKKIIDFVEDVRKFFSSGKKNYYHDAIFFVGPVIYRVLPESVKRVVVTDTDLKFLADVRELYGYFDRFSDKHVMALAHDAQPVYRHIFSSYRSRNPGTRVGSPPPDGLPGFNSGVMLQDLERMRTTDMYKSLLSGSTVKALADEYSFQGHLGDQGLYTLLNVKYEELFFVLPCNWNRQLCRWWERGYQDVFDDYFRCKGPVKIYHGNCGTPIPDDDAGHSEL